MNAGDFTTSEQQRAGERRHLLAAYFLPTLFVLFGLSSWISVNTIWVEMPLLATALPEGWDLPSYVSIVIQLGNIGPLMMLALQNKVRYSTIIYLIIGWLIASNIVLAFVNKITTPVGGVDHSLAFLIEVFFMALCDCTSNVTFLPYMANFNPRYLVYFFIGQGLSGLMPSILGLVQGSGSYECVHANMTNATGNSTAYPKYFPPSFDFDIFLFAATGLLVISLGGFIAVDLIYRRLKKRALEESTAPYSIPNSISDHITPISDIIQVPHLDPFKREPSSVTESSSTVQQVRLSLSDDAISESSPVVAGRAGASPVVYNAIDSRPQSSIFQDGEQIMASRLNRLPFKRKTYTAKDFVPEYCLNGFICFLANGLMPSLQSYSSVSYGQLVYTLVACLSVAATPLASWVTMFAKTNKTAIAGGIASIGVLPIAYIAALAILCPNVPLQHDVGGYFLVVFCWFLYSALFTYARVCIAHRVQNGGHKALFWFGLSTQGASLLGAITAFLLVAVFHVFKDPIMC